MELPTSESTDSGANNDLYAGVLAGLTAEEASSDPKANEPSESTGEPATEGIQNEISSWQQDKRFQKMWKGEPDNLYKSYRELEGKISPLSTQVKKYENDLQTYQRQLEEQSQKFSDYESRISEYEKIFETVAPYQDQILDLIQNLRNQEIAKKYGFDPEQNPQLINTLKRQEEIERRFEEFQRNQERERSVREFTAQVNGQVDQIRQFAAENSILVDDEVMNDFYGFCQKNNVHPSNMYHVFKSMAFDQLMPQIRASSAESVIKNQTQNRKKSTPGSRSGGQDNSIDYESLMRKALQR